MIQHKTDDNAFTGLEAAIVLIAFVVVAAVFSYVILGAGFFTTQKAQQTVYTAVAQSTSNIQMVGQVYGISPDQNSIQTIQFSIGLAPASPNLDISKLNIVFSTPNSAPVVYTAYTGGGTATPLYTSGQFIAQENGVGAAKLYLINQTQISFNITPAVVLKDTEMNIEIRPSVGAALPFSKTAPSQITTNNVLS